MSDQPLGYRLRLSLVLPNGLSHQDRSPPVGVSPLALLGLRPRRPYRW